MTRFNSVQVASGFDQTLTDSDNIEDFTPSTGSPKPEYLAGVGAVYCWVDGHPKEYSRGQKRNGFPSLSFAGWKRVVYNQPRMHVDTLTWLEANYEGLVTVNLRTSGTTYSQWNAHLSFEIVEKIAYNRCSVDWIFLLEEAI